MIRYNNNSDFYNDDYDYDCDSDCDVIFSLCLLSLHLEGLKMH